MESNRIVCTVVNDLGRKFHVRLVHRGERYGLNDCLVHGEGRNKIPESIAASGGYDGAMVEFWDATYENDPRFTLGLGQFASRYYLATLTGHDMLSAGRAMTSGLDLQGGVDAWKINATNVRNAIASAERALATR